MKPGALRAQQKRQLITLIGELHAAGMTSACLIAKALGVSRQYVRRVLADLRLVRPTKTLADVDTVLRLKVGRFQVETETSVTR